MDYIIHLVKTGGRKVCVEPEYEEGIYLYPGEIRKAGLKDGMELPEQDFRQLREEYAVPRAKKRALGILVKKDCTEKELRDKLTGSLHDAFSVERAIAFVKENGYVDDAAYARDYLYYKRGRKSFRQIRMELTRKGIEGQILDALFEEAGGQDAEELRPLVLKYIRRFPEMDAAAKQKTYAHFCRKGYPLSLVREILADPEIES